MKLFITSTLFLIFSVYAYGQQFLWAKSYEIPNCNEVAALAVDSNGYVFRTGVYNASFSLPYTGDCYLQKTDSEGEVIWTNYLMGSLQIGDMAAAGSSVVIIGKSNGAFTYQDVQYGSASSYSMFIMKIDSAGDVDWCLIDEENFGANTNLAIGKFGNIAAQIRGPNNLGDWVWIIDWEGNIIDTKEIYAEDSTIEDIAYYDGWVYLNGTFNGPGSMIIDTIVINVQPIEGTTFTLALDTNLVAKWVATDTTLGNHDGRVEANSSGIFVYETTLEPIFTLINYIKKFDFNGQLIKEVVAPTFTNAVALYPDMTLTPSLLGIFVNNDFDFNNHAVFLYDHDLDLVKEKYIDGLSDGYSGQISNYGDDVFVSHVYEGDLEFTDEILLPYSGTGKMAYMAKIGEQSTTGVQENTEEENILSLYPNPTTGIVYLNYQDEIQEQGVCSVYNQSGMEVFRQQLQDSNSSIDLSSLNRGVYMLLIRLENGIRYSKKVVLY